MSYTVKTNIVIDSPPRIIWDILVELDRYHEWNPFISRAKGRIAPGAIFEVSPKTEGRRRHAFVPQVTAYQQGQGFTWTGAFFFPWLALGDHSFQLTQLPDGQVRLDHDERIYGIGAWLVWVIGKRQIKTGFEAMNTALKARAEAIAQSAISR